jgi:hypothetical protein
VSIIVINFGYVYHGSYGYCDYYGVIGVIILILDYFGIFYQIYDILENNKKY